MKVLTARDGLQAETDAFDAVMTSNDRLLVERTIHNIIQRVLTIAEARGCTSVRSLAADFRGRMAMLTSEGNTLGYLDDPYLREMAVSGQEHFWKSKIGLLRELFARRDELMPSGK